MKAGAAIGVPAATAAPGRLDRLDALRGFAMLWMAAFHLCFDLNHFGWWSPRQNFAIDPFWTWQRTGIVSLFLLCAGASQAGALDAGQDLRRFAKRWAQIAGCALAVSIGSAWMFPRSWIYFGVLHGIAVMLLVLRLLAPLRTQPALLFVLGAIAVALPLLFQHPVFDARALNWVGLVTRKPITEDFVPVLPWLGVMLWGMAGGQWLLARHRAWLARPAPLPGLAPLGRWSLTFYMLHQPVFIGVLMAIRALR